jgi:2'-5' RNA ligase
MRLFVGIPLPPEARQRLSILLGGLPDLRWAAPENLHLTLRFIGGVDEGVAADIDLSLRGLRAPAFEMDIAGVGHFGNGERVRLLWAGVRLTPALQHLRDKVESAVVRAGLPPDGHKFVPHITLARGRGQPVPRLELFLTHHSLFRAGPVAVDRFVLFSSVPVGGRPHYREERGYALSPLL